MTLHGYYMDITGYYMDITGHYWILHGYYWILLDITWILLDITGYYWILVLGYMYMYMDGATRVARIRGKDPRNGQNPLIFVTITYFSSTSRADHDGTARYDLTSP
jgi:hypothetical protein